MPGRIVCRTRSLLILVRPVIDVKKKYAFVGVLSNLGLWREFNCIYVPQISDIATDEYSPHRTAHQEISRTIREGIGKAVSYST
jgi:hypothetical protein